MPQSKERKSVWKEGAPHSRKLLLSSALLPGLRFSFGVACLGPPSVSFPRQGYGGDHILRRALVPLFLPRTPTKAWTPEDYPSLSLSLSCSNVSLFPVTSSVRCRSGFYAR